MSLNASAIVVGPIADDKLTLTVHGPLTVNIRGLFQFIQKCHGVLDAELFDTESAIELLCWAGESRDQDAMRQTLSTHCQYWAYLVTGTFPNLGPHGVHVGLAEHMHSALS